MGEELSNLAEDQLELALNRGGHRGNREPPVCAVHPVGRDTGTRQFRMVLLFADP